MARKTDGEKIDELQQVGAALTERVNTTFERLKALRGHRDVIRIRRQVGEHILARAVGRGRPAVAGDPVRDPDFDRLHHAAGRVFDDALDGARAAQALGVRARHPDRVDRYRGLESR